MDWQLTSNPTITRLTNARGQVLYRCEQCHVVTVGHMPHGSIVCPHQMTVDRLTPDRASERLTPDVLHRAIEATFGYSWTPKGLDYATGIAVLLAALFPHADRPSSPPSGQPVDDPAITPETSQERTR